MTTIGYVVIYTPETGDGPGLYALFLYDNREDAEIVADEARRDSCGYERPDQFEVCSVESTS